MYSKRKVALMVFVTFLITTAAYTAAYTFVPAFGGSLANIRKTLENEFDNSASAKICEISDYVDDYYIGEYDKEEMADNAAAFYVATLDDPYSEYISKKDYKDMLEQLTGDYTGIGVEVYLDSDGLITVMNVFENAPAAKAGIVPGDKFTHVGDIKVSAETYEDAVNKMKGKDEKDTGKVSVKVLRDGKELSFEMKRAAVVNQTVQTKMLTDDIGYIRISQFDRTTGDDFDRLADLLLADGAKSFVIDLRSNPGGVLDGVIAVADKILGECKIMTVKDKSGEEVVYHSDKNEMDYPMCVLINGSSASASEVLAGAMRDNKKATLIGEKSYGKGVVQTVLNLSDGSAVKLTTAKYFTPSGECIHEKGISPDIEVKMTSNKPVAALDFEQDVQLQKAVEVLKKK